MFSKDLGHVIPLSYVGLLCRGSVILSHYCNVDFFLDCAQSTLIGNGNCNNEVNVAECNFDGGDCCSLCETIIFSTGVDVSINGHATFIQGI